MNLPSSKRSASRWASRTSSRVRWSALPITPSNRKPPPAFSLPRNSTHRLEKCRKISPARFFQEEEIHEALNVREEPIRSGYRFGPAFLRCPGDRTEFRACIRRAVRRGRIPEAVRHVPRRGGVASSFQGCFAKALRLPNSSHTRFRTDDGRGVS